jgi:hypothetical protein
LRLLRARKATRTDEAANAAPRTPPTIAVVVDDALLVQEPPGQGEVCESIPVAEVIDVDVVPVVNEIVAAGPSWRRTVPMPLAGREKLFWQHSVLLPTHWR